MAALSHCQDYSQPAKAYTYLLQYYLADSKQAFTDCSLLIIPEIVAFARESTKKYSWNSELFMQWKRLVVNKISNTQPTFTCSKLTIETLEQGEK